MSATQHHPAKGIRKFYYLSLLCLIPALGVLIGLILLGFAIFKFKNQKLILVIIGAMALGTLFFKIANDHRKEKEGKQKVPVAEIR